MRRKKGTIMIALGVLLLIGALGLTGYNFWDAQRAQETAQTITAAIAADLPAPVQQEAIPEDPGEVEIPDYILNPKMAMPAAAYEGWDCIGILEIPSYGLTLPVISEWSYPALKTAPCRYTGSAYTDDLIIAAHNYRAHFGALQELQEGEEVVFTDIDGNVFRYQVAVRETLQPTAVEEMQSGDWDLTLFTCTAGGSYRVTVRCERIGS